MSSKFILFKINNERGKRSWFIYFFFFFIIWAISFSCEAADLRINFIDVGEGESVLIQTPNNKNILIDTGNLITGFKVVEYLRENNIIDLEYLIITHHDLDHIGGTFFVMQMLNVHKIRDNGQKLSRSNDVLRWYEVLIRKRNNYEVLGAGDEIEIDEVTLRAIWPKRPFIFSDFNSNSIVILMEYKDFGCLLTGDLTLSAEKEILKNTNDLKAEVLKVNHHGHSDANSEEFLKAVSPKISVISVDKDNFRGYPSQEVIQRLHTLNAKLYRTDRDGTITIKVSSVGDIKVLTEK